MRLSTPRRCAGAFDSLADRTTLMDAKTVTTWMNEVAGAVRAERDYLIQLDAAIGDGITAST